MTHPVQYWSPWFRFLTERVPDVDLSVVYATLPSAEQQGVGFDQEVTWDVPLLEGYSSEVIRPSRPGERLDSDSFWGIDVPEIGAAVLSTRPDVALVSGWQSVCLVRAVRACRANHIPVLYRGDSHGASQQSSLRRALSRLRARWMLRHFSGYLVAGKRARDYLESFGLPKSSLFDVPHCVDNAFFADRASPHQTEEGRALAREALGLKPDDFVILLAGKLTRAKRPQDAIRAIANMDENVKLLVAGSGPLESECRALAENLGAPVSFAGFMNQTALPKAYAVSDCLVLPARETWGLVVNEAFATGLPCVANDTAGCVPDLIEPGKTGEVYRFGDVSSLCSALSRLRSVGPAAMGERCRELVSAFSYERASAGLMDACRAVLDM